MNEQALEWWKNLSDFVKEQYKFSCEVGVESDKNVTKMYKFYLKEFKWKR